jgi:predicted dehydrogenase
MAEKKAAEQPIQESEALAVGLIGYGGIGRIHTVNWRNLNLYYPDLPKKIRLRGAATQSQTSAAAAVKDGGYEYGTTDYQDLLQDPEIDLIDICTPNHTHFEIFQAALAAGKHIYIEKPLALNLEQARIMHDLSKDSDRIVQIAFNYRFVPAVMKAKELIRAGFLGEVLNFRAQYYHSSYLNPKKPMSWRLTQEKSGGGALVDLGAHIIDLMLYLAGPFKRVLAQTKTFIDQRPANGEAGSLESVVVDDHAQLLVELAAGGIGIVEASRIAAGTTDDLNFEIHGTKGALKYDFMDPNWLYVYDAGEAKKPLGGNHGFKQVQTMHSYPGNQIPGERSTVNFLDTHANSQYQVVRASLGLQLPEPTTQDGVLVQQILEASYRSAREERWVALAGL